ncbi:lipopolysaccharide kinase InaA family protein [Methylophaga lonarensis]|uniref:lipopolysaccharide kinase InaA family protein n=1 Tax=Methylophaga lonarensis TaxID=999151 RepID=UPI003D2BFDBF
MTEFPDRKSKQLLSKHKLDDFDSLWTLKSEWFEAPNERRGGWSGVVKYALEDEQNKQVVFIKRQENHITRTWRHPFRGVPTFQKEYRNIQRLINKQIPTLEPIYFGLNKMRSILVTRSLEKYQSLDTIDPATLAPRERRRLLKKLARVISTLHTHHYQHNCLYPKHIFVRFSKKGRWKVRLIDLEKMKWTPLKRQAMVRDLQTLHRHSGPNWNLRDRVYFMQKYFNEPRLSAKSRRIWQIVDRKTNKKNA